MTQKILGSEIRKTNNAVKRYIDAQCAEKLSFHLTGIEGFLMKFLSEHDASPVTASEIMANSHVNKATVSEALSALKRKGFIISKPLSGDRRVKAITLTERGRKAHEEFLAILNGTTSQVEKDVTPQERVQLCQLLDKIRANVGDKEQ
jgi:DNA-binding MarR family transcriptional regulator